ncbi:MAG: magnesium and cobalt transporter [Rickettsiales bacterium]|jgi:magnesium and cobalt transporter
MDEHPSLLHKSELKKDSLIKLIISFFKDKRSYFSSRLKNIIIKSYNVRVIGVEQKSMIDNILKISQIRVGDIMVPRSNINAVEKKTSLEEIKKAILDKEHSRMPVYNKNLDNILGFIHCKDLTKFINNDRAKFKISDISRKILYVPHSMKITNLLVKMRSSGVHIAIILDEYGGTDGIITLEDIIEEIVGEIKDEHDILEDNVYLTKKKISDNAFHFGGRVDIEEVEEVFGINIAENEDDDFETVGGFMFFILKKIPEISESFKRGGLSFKVLDSDSKSIKLIEVTKMNN